jgi:hypothetical protein
MTGALFGDRMTLERGLALPSGDVCDWWLIQTVDWP